MAQQYSLWLLLLLLSGHVNDCWAVLGEDCSGGNTAACTVENSICGITDTCGCENEFTEVNGECHKVLGDMCTTDDDCVAVVNSKCDIGVTGVCICDDAHIQAGNACTAKGLGDSCTADSNCEAVDNSQCDVDDTGNCICDDTHKPSGDASSPCTEKGLGDSCTADSNCAAVDNSQCDVNGTGNCMCDDTHKPSGDASSPCTEKAVNETQCTAEGGGCEHINNAICDAESRYCTCNSGFMMNVATCENAAASLEVGAVILVLSVLATIQIMF